MALHVLTLVAAFLIPGSRPVDPAPTPLCDVTRPNGRTPPAWAASPDNHGDGSLFTIFWPEGTIVFRPGGPGELTDDGSLRMKIPWFSTAGDVTVIGRRLDGEAPTLRARVTRASTPKGMYPSSLFFPTEGCCEVTARAGEAA